MKARAVLAVFILLTLLAACEESSPRGSSSVLSEGPAPMAAVNVPLIGEISAAVSPSDSAYPVTIDNCGDSPSKRGQSRFTGRFFAWRRRTTPVGRVQRRCRNQSDGVLDPPGSHGSPPGMAAGGSTRRAHRRHRRALVAGGQPSSVAPSALPRALRVVVYSLQKQGRPLPFSGLQLCL